MKENWKLILILILMAAIGGIWVAGALTHDLVVLHSGEVIYADGVWSSGQSVFFSIGNEMDFRESELVRDIVIVSLTDPASWLAALAAHFSATVQWFKAPDMTTLAAGLNTLLAIGPWLLILILCCAVFVLGWKQFRKKQAEEKEKKEKTQPQIESDGLLPQLAGPKDVATLFADIYRIQLKAPADAPIRIAPVSRTGEREVLELKVKYNGKWRSRRMTLSPIGENTGSKSQCYYVIFDTHIVVKVPPKPITSFEDYLEHLRSEARIKKRLSPKECVIPNLSVVLKKIKPYPDADDLSPEALEDRYAFWLEENPEFRNCLKLRGGFVFFMDLARYFFLGNVLSFFHDTGGDLQETVRADTDLIGNFTQFEDKYGEAAEEVFNDLQNACEDFQREMTGVMVESDEPIDVPDRSVREWILFAMAGVDPNLEKDVPSERMEQTIRMRLSKTESAYGEAARKYRAMIHRNQAPGQLRRTRPLMGEMTTNLLVLLSWLSENKVALRDLKPDNLLVAGNPDEYPNFLTSAKQYAIGLIDLETAVDYGDGGPGSIPQPQLGGTPLYATPAHFIQNKLLKEVHGNLESVFLFQDWYAISAIIYEMIVGECLFSRTARQLAALMQGLRAAMANGENLVKAYLTMSVRFWDVSIAEFNGAMELNGRSLEAVGARVPESVRSVLHESTRLEKTRAWEQVETCLEASPVLSRGENRKRLIQCNALQVGQIRSKYAKSKKMANLLPVLDKLIVLKKKAEQLAQLDEQFSRPFPKISVRDLLVRMMETIEKGLCPDDSILASIEPRELPAPAGNDAMDETVQGETVQGETIRGTDREGLGFTITVEL